MRSLIAFICVALAAIVHGVAVLSWVDARGFSDWNFYAHATWAEWKYYHLHNALPTIVYVVLGASFVLVGILAVSRR